MHTLHRALALTRTEEKVVFLLEILEVVSCKFPISYLVGVVADPTLLFDLRLNRALYFPQIKVFQVRPLAKLLCLGGLVPLMKLLDPKHLVLNLDQRPSLDVDD